MNTNKFADARNTTHDSPNEDNETREIYFAINKRNNTASLIQASCFEDLQGMFRFGIMLPDETMATGIGRCASESQFIAKAKHGRTRVL